MSRKSLYLSESQFKGKTRGNTRGKTPDKRSLDEDFEFSAKELSLIREAFEIIDTSETGVISKEDLLSILELMKGDFDIGQRMLQDLTSMNELITFDIFARHILRNRGNRHTLEGVGKIFDLIDNGKGKITVECLQNLCDTLGEHISEREIENSIKKIAPEAGYINFDEFLAVMNPNKSKKR